MLDESALATRTLGLDQLCLGVREFFYYRIRTQEYTVQPAV
jgi:hypothetical protein